MESRNSIRKHFSTKFKVFDVIVIAVGLAIATLTWLSTDIYLYYADTGNKIVEIQLQDEVIKKIDYNNVKEQQKIVLYEKDYDKLNSDVTIIIDPNKGICIEEIECPNHQCVKQGWVALVNHPIVCVPNSLMVTITSTSDIDIVV